MLKPQSVFPHLNPPESVRDKFSPRARTFLLLCFQNVIGGWGCLLPDGALFLPPSVLPINREKACFEVFQSIVLVYGYWVFIAFFTPFPEGRSCKCKSPY